MAKGEASSSTQLFHQL